MVCLQGKTISQVAREMYVSHSTVERFLHLYHTTGEVRATQQKHGPDRLLDDFEQLTVLQSLTSQVFEGSAGGTLMQQRSGQVVPRCVAL